MPDLEREQMPFRLPADQMSRLERVARYRRQTRQRFVEDVVMTAVAEVEEERRTKGGRRKGEDAQPKPNPNEPAGLGIAALMRRREELAAETRDAPVAVAPVVVNVGGGESARNGNNDVVTCLANYVAAAKGDFERESRLRTAVKILSTSAATDQEREALAAKLDVAVGERLQRHEGVIKKVARLTFDKVAGILGDR